MNIDLSEQTDMDFKPTLYNVHEVLNQEIVGEYRARMSLFTNFVLADKFVLMSGPRSSGKTYISDHIRDYFLGDLEKGNGTAFSVTMGSKKAGWYQVDKINRASHVFIFELNQMPEDFIEVLKQWGEGKDASYKVTVQQGGIRTVQNYKLKKKPTVFCLADEQETKIGEQLLSRLTVIRTDSSISQNKRVMGYQAEEVRVRENPRKVDKELLNKLRAHVATMPPYRELIFKHPASDIFVKAIPPFFTDSRRDFPKYLENTFGITRFYWKERITAPVGKTKRMIFVTPSDMFLNHVVYGQTLVESALKCSPVQRDMIEIIKALDQPADRQTVQRNLRKIGYNISGYMCSRQLNELADIGYLEREKKSGVNYYTVGDLFNEFEFTVDWQEVIRTAKINIRKEFPEVADKYIAMYCTNPTVIHPFSGNVIKLNELKEQTLKLTKPKSDLASFIKEDKEKQIIKKIKEVEEEMEVVEEKIE